MSDILKIGMNSLLAYQNALTVTSQNMANVSTPYYSRRVVDLTENYGYNGVSVADVERIFDNASSLSLQNSNSTYSYSDTMLQQLTELESQLDTDKNSVGSYINNILTQLRTLNDSVDKDNNRSLFIDRLNILAGRFNTLSGQLQLQQQDVNQSLTSVVNTINQLTTQIANVNLDINNSLGDDVSSLLDQREALLQNLAQYCDFSRDIEANGNMNIVLGNGTLLISNSTAYQLSTVQDAMNPTTLDVILQDGPTAINVTNAFHNGQVASLYDFQKTSLVPAQIALDRLSLVMAYQFNAQNQLGMDGYGNIGNDIFTDVNSTVQIGNRAVADLNNSGNENLTVNITNPAQLTQYSYKLTFDTDTTYILTRSDGTQMSTGSVASLPQSVSVDGFQLNINSGTVAAGDNFTILPCNGYAGSMSVLVTDPKKLALGWPVTANANPQNGGTGQISVSDMTDTTTSAFATPGQLSPPIMVQFLSPTQYQLVDTTTNATLAGPLTYDPQNGTDIFPTGAPSNIDPGYRIHLSGTIRTGDTFNITYNTGSNSQESADNRNGIAMEKMFKTNIVGGSLTFSGAFNNLINNVANQTNSATINYNSSQILQEQSESNYAQISGVSIDEEYVNLTQYQQAYQASAQIIDTARNIFDIMMSVTRR